MGPALTMFTRHIFALVGFLVLIGASPILGYNVVHEKRSSAPPGWLKREPLEKDAVLPISIALTQRNLDKGYEWLMDVSDPTSSKYGRHWDAASISSAFAPCNDTVDAVRAWLISAGIASERVKQSDSRGWLKFKASVSEAEDLFKTRYHIYEHSETGQQHAACEEYSVPAHMKDKIDFVTPSVHFDVKLRARDTDNLKGSAPKRGPSGGGPKLKNWIDYSDIIKELRDCDKQITTWCLRVLYEFPPGRTANATNSFGIVEYTPEVYVPSDLDLFFKNFSTSQVGERPTLDSIDGGSIEQANMSFTANGESDLDLEYAMSLVYPQKVTLYQVGDEVEGASFNNFLDGIDASYCTYEGGDDPTQDAPYPDPSGGYQGPKDCGKYEPTKVISTSYSSNEHDLTPAYENRQCNEYMKLGLMGVSVLYSSGDYGVAGNPNQCINGAGSDAPSQNGTLGGRFNPSFPGSCPYITSVGATQVKPGVDIMTTKTQQEMACETVIYSGGGFSNVFPLPSYQASAVKGWFKDHPPPYTSEQFNNSQETRGFPDISANGANYVVAVDGKWALLYGTSASSPTLGSILTLINEERFNAGKGSIGFINPVAYAHPEVFNDITEGNNPGCATSGFNATTGWDPVTGLGTPNYRKLLELFLSLAVFEIMNV
ncbi:subtilisin-like protein [Pleomassaria siparia CBS 279.74]|uniref:tripeptidyl-peptidase II n=1 Tax=Pleomassaria siparia CBS 279.74 TaxID=1314801 RepID=A0A6G1K074_9PLEO|nr:subtilisin-like protein [Pleomassaria siparia CBS 279.74]